MNDDVWVFGYGSLVWRPGFDYLERQIGFINGWARRFYQGSIDHRGVPGAPGRVVTIIDQPGAQCWGVTYRLCEQTYHDVFDYLDEREQGGFDRFEIDVHVREGDAAHIKAHMYVADQHNDNYLGSASQEDMALQVYRSHGPSGSNVEYLMRLAESLRHMNVVDEHVFELERHVLSFKNEE